MKTALIILVCVAIVFTTFAFIFMNADASPIDKNEAIQQMENSVKKAVQTCKEQTGATVLIHSDKLGIHEVYGYERGNGRITEKANADEPFHIASIGKTFTAVLIAKLSDEGKLDFEDRIADYLDAQTLQSLFVYEGVDYKDEVTIKQLLSHTSGIADYFEDPADTKPIAELLIAEPNRIWKPMELLDFTRVHQKAFNKPGIAYHYSDTGYILLGLLSEKVTGKPFHENLRDAFFAPLGMDDSYLFLCDEPKNQPKKELAKIYFRGSEISKYNSLSIDWAGGGIVSTVNDLLKFHMALEEGNIISKDTLDRMKHFDNRFRAGIYYGMGFMQLRFEELFFLLKDYPRVTGNTGSLSTHMYYDDVHDAYIIANFGSDADMGKSIRTIISIVSLLNRLGTQ